MNWPIQRSDFEGYFQREFPYGPGKDSVTPGDITRAIGEATTAFSTPYWQNATERGIAFLYLTAHFLQWNIEQAGGLTQTNRKRGLKSLGRGVVQSKSVGGVSVNYALIESLVKDPVLGPLCKTSYGQKYLELLRPRLPHGFVVSGQTWGYWGGE